MRPMKRRTLSRRTNQFQRFPFCFGLLNFKADKHFRAQAVKWAVMKLQGDKIASFCREMSGRKVTEINQHPSLPWSFLTHGFLDPSVFS